MQNSIQAVSDQHTDVNTEFVTAKTSASASILDELKAVRDHASSKKSFLTEFARCAMRPGRMTFQEYVNLRLWDKDLYAGTDVRSFLGFLGMRDVYLTANFDIMLHGIMQNKLSANAVLSAHGLKTIETVNLHSRSAIFGKNRTSTAAELAERLLHDVTFPVFGKPLAGLRSLGSIALIGADANSRTVFTAGQKAINVDDLARSIDDEYGSTGFLFQPAMVPAADVAKICGERLATVRVLTISDGNGSRIIRACWKIPGGANQADNYWRKGNLIAGVDVETGRLGRPMSGMGFDYIEHASHPDSLAPLEGIALPGWDEIKRAALAGAQIMPDFGLIGWDIAYCADGATVVEMNETPDLALHQLADKRGIYDGEFQVFVQEMKAKAKLKKSIWRQEEKKELAFKYV